MHNEQIKLLDYGYLQFIESWGTGLGGVPTDRMQGVDCPDCEDGTRHVHRTDYEVGIIEAARQSTQKGFQGWEAAPCNCKTRDSGSLEGYHLDWCNAKKYPGDKRLLAFLYDKKHSTPFEFAGMTIEVRAPISVFREWHRHRTESYSEASARYAPLPALDYVPSVDRCMIGTDMTNKQAGASKGSAVLTPETAEMWLRGLEQWQFEGQQLYETGLNIGLPKEVARGAMSVYRYSTMRATANLRNWLAFMTLRTDPDAQWEIRQYANQVAAIIREVFPQTYRKWSGKDQG